MPAETINRLLLVDYQISPFDRKRLSKAYKEANRGVYTSFIDGKQSLKLLTSIGQSGQSFASIGIISTDLTLIGASFGQTILSLLLEQKGSVDIHLIIPSMSRSLVSLNNFVLALDGRPVYVTETPIGTTGGITLTRKLTGALGQVTGEDADIHVAGIYFDELLFGEMCVVLDEISSAATEPMTSDEIMANVL
jgi:hypothetical protein